jgi:spore germination protein
VRSRKNYLFLACLLCLSLAGCTRANIIDQLTIIHVYGFDLDEKGYTVNTALYPQHTKSRGDESIQLLSEKAPYGSLIPQRMDKLTSTPTKISKIRVLVLGRKFAEAGITNQVKRFITTPQLGTNIQIVVSEGTAAEALKTLKKRGELTLMDQIRHNMEHRGMPNMNLHIFLNHFFGEGLDAYTPIVSVHKHGLKVDGLALFKDDKFKYSLKEKQTFIFTVLQNVRQQGTYKIEVKEKGKKDTIIVSGYKSRKNWDFVGTHQHPRLKLTLNLVWTANQYPEWMDVSKPEDLDKLKKIIEKDIKKETEKLLTTLEKHEVDPLGIGNIVRSRDRKWDEKTFYEKKYPNLPIEVTVHAKIIHTGLES